MFYRETPFSDDIAVNVPYSSMLLIEGKVSELSGEFVERGRVCREDRAESLTRMSVMMLEKRQDHVRPVVAETGEPIILARGEFEIASAIFRRATPTGATTLTRNNPAEFQGSSILLVNPPLGVGLGARPWTFPYLPVARCGAATLTVEVAEVAKPVPQYPSSVGVLKAIFQAWLAEPVVYSTNTAAPDHDAETISWLAIQNVSPTGSKRAGCSVAGAAGKQLKQVVLELGRSDPFVVLSADTLAEVVEAKPAFRISYGGQVVYYV